MLKKTFQIVFFLLVCVSWAQLAQAEYPLQEKDSLTSIDSLISYSPEIVNQKLVERDFSENPKEKYTGADFTYHDDIQKTSIWEKIKRQFQRWLSHWLDERNHNLSDWAEYILYGICGLIIGLAFYFSSKFLAKRKGNLLFEKKAKSFKIEAEEIIEDIHEIDFNQIISQYELQQNFKAALRFQFLKTLKQYTDGGKIHWTQEKTNSDYLHELKNPTDKKHFERAVYIFDHVWYGDFEINEAAYRAFTQEVQLKPESHEQ